MFILAIFIYHCYCFLLKFAHCGLFMAALCCTNLHQNWKELWPPSLRTQGIPRYHLTQKTTLEG